MIIGQHANGKFKFAVIDAATGEVVSEQTEWQHNLILNRGLQEVSNRRWSECFGAGILGTDGKANSRSSFSTTAEVSFEGTVTLNGPGFTFSAGTDVGNVIKFNSGGQEHRIVTVTNGTQAYVTPPPTGGTITPGLFTFYHANYTQLGAEVKRSATYLTGNPYSVSSIDTGTGVIKMRRTYDFSAEASNITYREFGVGWGLVASANTTFSRVVIPGGFTVLTGQQVRLTYQLEITMSPITPVVGNANVVGWPVAPSVSTAGTYQLQLVAMGNVASTGADGAFASGQFANEPSNTFRTYLWLTNSNAALAAFNAAPPNRENILATTKFANVDLVSLNVSGIVYSVYKVALFSVSSAVATDHRSFGLGYTDGSGNIPADAAWTFVLDENQSKSNIQTLTMATLHQWSRSFVPDAT